MYTHHHSDNIVLRMKTGKYSTRNIQKPNQMLADLSALTVHHKTIAEKSLKFL